MESIRDIIRKKYTMDRELTAWRWEVQQLEAEVPRKIYELREANVALTEYEGSLRSFLDKLSGKQRENQEIRSKAVREAKAALEASRWQLSSAQNALAALEEEAKALPTREELFETYPDMEYLKRQDALLCADRAVKLLRENEKYLMEARDWSENRNWVPSMTSHWRYRKARTVPGRSAACWEGSGRTAMWWTSIPISRPPMDLSPGQPGSTASRTGSIMPSRPFIPPWVLPRN